MITNIVDQCRKHFVPNMRKRKKRKPLWMDNRTHKAQKTKQKREPSDENWKDYKKALNIFTMESRRSKEKFEMRVAEKIKHELKSFFSYARSKSRPKHSISHPEQMFTGDTKEHVLDVDMSQSIVEKKLKKIIDKVNNFYSM